MSICAHALAAAGVRRRCNPPRNYDDDANAEGAAPKASEPVGAGYNTMMHRLRGAVTLADLGEKAQ